MCGASKWQLVAATTLPAASPGRHAYTKLSAQTLQTAQALLVAATMPLNCTFHHSKVHSRHWVHSMSRHVLVRQRTAAERLAWQLMISTKQC